MNFDCPFCKNNIGGSCKVFGRSTGDINTTGDCDYKEMTPQSMEQRAKTIGLVLLGGMLAFVLIVFAIIVNVVPWIHNLLSPHLK